MINESIKIVSAGILRDGNKILLARRSMNGSVGGKWEFPGGKKESGETIEECLVREIKEELNLKINVIGMIGESDYVYSHGSFRLIGIEANVIDPLSIVLNVHDDYKWIDIADLLSYDLAPADIELAQMVVSTFNHISS